ncbi:MAG: cell envelope integrity protein TolA [Nitrospira sp.]|nr:cell envelope integrity protein TolA [Nitrospira sp.]
MAVEFYPNLLTLSGVRHQPVTPARWTLLVSLALHLCVLALVVGFHTSPRMERPLASYQVSLVRLSTPSQAPVPAPQRAVEQEQAVRAAEPTRPSEQDSSPVALPPAPVQQRSAGSLRQPAKQAAPAPVPVRPTAPKAAPLPPAAAPQELREVRHQAENPLRDVLRGIELPPEAPKLGAANPAPPVTSKALPAQSQKDMQKLLGNLTVPDQASRSQAAPPVSQPRKALSEDVARQLQALQQPRPSEARQAEAPSQQAKVPAAKTPDVAINVPGVAPNLYLARVQSKISSQWIAPPVDLTGKTLRVVIRFRLDRSGSVSNVVVETTSGNGYYDDAGRRAVLKADPLPPFPKDMTELYLDTHFSFTVGEDVG